MEFFENYQAIIAVLVVIAGWFLTQRSAILRNKAKNSYEEDNLLESRTYSDTIKRVSQFWNVREQFENEKIPTEVFQDIWDIFQFLEVSAANVNLGYTSLEYYRYTMRSYVIFFFESEQLFFRAKRKNSHTIYENCEFLYTRLKYPKLPFFIKLLEFFSITTKLELSHRFFVATACSIDGPPLQLLYHFVFRTSLPDDFDYADFGKRQGLKVPGKVSDFRGLEILILILVLVAGLVFFKE